MERALMAQVEEAEVPSGALLVGALGQSGFLLKNSRGTVLAVDPALADPVGRLNPERGRLYPSPVQPEELRCDVLVVTHDHLDHLDPDTIAALEDGAVGRFVGPGNACRHFAKLGVEDDRIVRLDASQSVELQGVGFTGVFAVTNDPSQPDAEGVLVRMEDAPSVYHTGDTTFHPLLARAARERPDIYMPCINGRYGNMDAFEAAVLGAVLRPRWAVPHHYDMFRENLADPERFRGPMSRLAPETECVVLAPGETFLFSKGAVHHGGTETRR